MRRRGPERSEDTRRLAERSEALISKEAESAVAVSRVGLGFFVWRTRCRDRCGLVTANLVPRP